MAEGKVYFEMVYKPLPTSAWDILPFLQAENIYDCEENNLEILKQAIIDEIVGLRSDVVRLRAERDEAIAFCNDMQAAGHAISQGAQAAHDIWRKEQALRKVAEAERDRLRDEDDATRRELGERFTLVPPDGGDVKTHEAAKAAIETLAVVERERDRSTEAHERAAAERDRLREALFWYADQMCEYSTCYEGCGKLTEYDCAGCKARAALKGDTP